jgi:hypothetical protein
MCPFCVRAELTPETTEVSPRTCSEPGSRAAVSPALSFVQLLDGEAAAILCRRRIRFTSASQRELAALRAAVRPVYADLAQEPDAGRVLLAIRATKEKPGIAASAPRCRSVEEEVMTSRATRLDGIYETSFTRGELAESPLLMDAGEINHSNWGSFRIALSRGRFSYVQHNEHSRSAARGTYSLQGDAIDIHFDQGVNAGETYSLRAGTSTAARSRSGAGHAPVRARTRSR